MGNIYVNNCSETATSQQWVVLADGRIAFQPSAQSKAQHFIAPKIGQTS